MNGYLIVNGLVFLIVGLRALCNPLGAVADPYSLEADNVDAKNYLRSGAGGVATACGVVLLLAALFQQLSFAALLMAVTVMGGLVFGRLVSLVVDGKPSATPWIAGALELTGFLIGAYWLAKVLR